MRARGAHRLEHVRGRDRVLLEVDARALEAVAHVGVGLQVEDRVAARASPRAARRGRARRPRRARAARRSRTRAGRSRSCRRSTTSTPSASSRSARLVPMKPGAAGDQRALHSVNPAVDGVAVEHLDGLQRELLEVLAERAELGQQVAGHRDDVAADRVRLDDVEHLARAGPDQLGPRRRAHDLQRLAHDRHGSRPVSAIRPANTEMQLGAPSATAAVISLTCAGVNSAVTLTWTPSSRARARRRRERLAARSSSPAPSRRRSRPSRRCVRAWRRISSASSANTSNEIGRSVISPAAAGELACSPSAPPSTSASGSS